MDHKDLLDDDSDIALTTKDGTVYISKSLLIEQSPYIRAILEMDQLATSIHIPKFSIQTVRYIVDFLKKRLDSVFEIPIHPKRTRPDECYGYDEVISNLPFSELEHIINCAHYLDIQSVAYTAMVPIALCMRNHKADEIRKTFDIPNDDVNLSNVFKNLGL